MPLWKQDRKILKQTFNFCTIRKRAVDVWNWFVAGFVGKPLVSSGEVIIQQVSLGAGTVKALLLIRFFALNAFFLPSKL
jgi:hypothetical protein